MRTELLLSIEQLEPYKHQWNSLYDVQPFQNPFLHLDWVIEWWRFFGASKHVVVFHLHDDHQSIAFFPFCITHVMDHVVIETIGKGHANYSGALIHPEYVEQSIGEISRQLIKLFPKTLFEFHGIHDYDFLHKTLENKLQDHAIPFVKTNVHSPIVDLQQDLQGLLSKMLHKHSLNRRMRKLHMLGKVRVSPIVGDQMHAMFDLHEDHWKYKWDTSHFHESPTKEFHQALFEKTTAHAFIQMFGLYCNEKLIAYIFGYRTNTSFLMYSIAHHDSYQLYSPGRHLIYEVMKRLAAENVQFLDLSIGEELYKSEIQTTIPKVSTYVINPSNKRFSISYYSKSLWKKTIQCLKSRPRMIHFKRHTLGKLRKGKFPHIQQFIHFHVQYFVRLPHEKLVECVDILPSKCEKNDSSIEFTYYGFEKYHDKECVLWIHEKKIKMTDIPFEYELPRDVIFIGHFFGNLAAESLAQLKNHYPRDEYVFAIRGGQLTKWLQQDIQIIGKLQYARIGRLKKLRWTLYGTL